MAEIAAARYTPLEDTTANAGTVLALGFLALLLLAAAAAPWLAPHDPLAQPDIVGARLAPPSAGHLFGTDVFSRDVISRVLYGARISLAVGVLATALSVTLGTVYGLIAGYAGGVLDGILMRLLDGFLAIPRVLLVLVLVSASGSLPLPALIAVLGLTGWFHVARLVRAEALVARELDYVTAARALGASGWRIVTRHILPNVLTPAAVAAVLGFAHTVVLEAGLSYLGLGVQPPAPSWGNIMLEGTEQLGTAWWVALFPGAVLFATVVSVNTLAERIRSGRARAIFLR
ncbi:MAG: ABC transporter permease [Gemmatimonadaceae bacterium]